ncbi:Permeases of the major facilitator superfamily (modular protein) [Xanthomonas citri pv. citri]|nr:Permeases of the major facilitator superfamily (modular protein) [Xanthomonas citri pv. citri]CEJ21920.1 Permeases of the major facilitator superfamily (modular protein) [Xanthomonas citri pv. citri]CEJ26510.1 Permeases of the major facilitator superfamily (modular protein) [Xanthomonas citri pv. citri]
MRRRTATSDPPHLPRSPCHRDARAQQPCAPAGEASTARPRKLPHGSCRPSIFRRRRDLTPAPRAHRARHRLAVGLRHTGPACPATLARGGQDRYRASPAGNIARPRRLGQRCVRGAVLAGVGHQRRAHLRSAGSDRAGIELPGQPGRAQPGQDLAGRDRPPRRCASHSRLHGRCRLASAVAGWAQLCHAHRCRAHRRGTEPHLRRLHRQRAVGRATVRRVQPGAYRRADAGEHRLRRTACAALPLPARRFDPPRSLQPARWAVVRYAASAGLSRQLRRAAVPLRRFQRRLVRQPQCRLPGRAEQGQRYRAGPGRRPAHAGRQPGCARRHRARRTQPGQPVGDERPPAPPRTGGRQHRRFRELRPVPPGVRTGRAQRRQAAAACRVARHHPGKPQDHPHAHHRLICAAGERALEALHEQVSARADLPSLQHSRRRAVLSELVPPCASRYADTPFARRHVCGGQQQMLAAQLWRLVAPQPPGAITARRPR